MSAQLLEGKKVANEIKLQLAGTIKSLVNNGTPPPELAVILVGNDPASEIYVRNKRKACAEVGIISHAIDLPPTTSLDEIINVIDTFNQNPAIKGILVQLPLPFPLESNKIIERILPSKDVDGFHPYNLGRLAQRLPLLRPCTPFGIIQLLKAYHLPIHGKHAVVVGASNIVGRPMALEFLLAGATVTICHRFTENLEKHIRAADIIVVATGVYNIISPDWLNKEQVLIDVGMHRTDEGTLHGDVDFQVANETVGWITPVPGGVGPMTIAALLQNTCKSYLNGS